MKLLPSVRALALLWCLAATTAGQVGEKAALLRPGVDVPTAGNGVYNVHVENQVGLGAGQYAATTGPLHPAGAGHSVLFGSGSPRTSFNTLRSYTSQTDYVQSTHGPASQFPVVRLEAFHTASAPLGTGFSTSYAISGRDDLTVTQIVRTNGTTPADASIEVTTIIRNDGTAPVALGLRYFWDFQVGSDDGPTLQEQGPSGPVRIHETEFSAPSFGEYHVVDNDTSPEPPTFTIVGSINGPSGLAPAPTTPDVFQYVCWPDAYRTAFDYTVNPVREIATTTASCRGFAGGDVAVAYLFGPDAARAVTIAPGATRTLSASLLGLNVPPCSGTVTHYGQGCPGAGGRIPRIDVIGCPAIGNRTTIQIDNVVGGTFVCVLFGSARWLFPVVGCQLQISNPQLVCFPLGGLPGFPGGGFAQFTWRIPNQARFIGYQLNAQIFAADPLGPQGVSASDGLEAIVGS